MHVVNRLDGRLGRSRRQHTRRAALSVGAERDARRAATIYSWTVKVILTVIGLVLLVAVWQFAMHLWEEWHGAFGRWRRGEPLRLGEFLAQQWKAERERRELRMVEMRRAYEAVPSRILDRDFHREFKDLGIHDEIYADVIARSGRTCAGCGRVFSTRMRKPLLHVDHIKPRVRYPSLIYVLNNLQVLCRPCNVHKHAYDGDDWQEVVAARRKATRAKKAKARRASKPIDDFE